MERNLQMERTGGYVVIGASCCETLHGERRMAERAIAFWRATGETGR
jgi:hypothetical protein